MNKLKIKTELEYNVIKIDNSKYSVLELIVTKDPLNLFHIPHKYYILENHKIDKYLKNPHILQNTHINPINPLYKNNEVVLMGSDIFLSSLQKGEISFEDFIINSEQNLHPFTWSKSPYKLENLIQYNNVFPIHLHKEKFNEVNPSYIMDEKNNMLYFEIFFYPNNVHYLKKENTEQFTTNFDPNNNMWFLFLKDPSLYNYSYQSINDLFNLYKYQKNNENRFPLMKCLIIKCLKIEEPLSPYLSKMKSNNLFKELDKLALNYHLKNQIETKDNIESSFKMSKSSKKI